MVTFAEGALLALQLEQRRDRLDGTLDRLDAPQDTRLVLHRQAESAQPVAHLAAEEGTHVGAVGRQVLQRRE